MYQDLQIRAIAAGTVFKLAFVGLVVSLVPLTTAAGIFSLFGASTLTWNQKPLTGVSGLLASPFIGLFIAAVFTMLVGGLMALGLWLCGGRHDHRTGFLHDLPPEVPRTYR